MKRITDMERRELIDSPYVIKTTSNKVEFSSKFRKEYLNLINCRGYDKKAAFRQLGIRPEILGDERINQLTNTFKLIEVDIEKDKYKNTIFKNSQEELEYYKRYSFRLEHALILLTRIDQNNKNYRPILDYIENNSMVKQN